jgi:SulP family sulfate permease
MTSSIVSHTQGQDHDVVMATTLCWLAMSTALLGVAVWLIGKLKLAVVVQYLPMPVIGGYLAFIGLFCFEAGTFVGELFRRVLFSYP